MKKSIELDEVQALVFRGHGDMPCSQAVWLAITDPSAACGPLRQLADERVSFGAARLDPVRPRLQLFFSAAGLRRLGAMDDRATTFHRSFAQGITAPHRMRALGDTGRNHPDGWHWQDRTAHVVVMVYAPDATGARVEAERVEQALAAGCAVIHRLNTCLPADEREPFGFRDGLSKVVVRRDEGESRSPADESLLPGEVVLGYADATGEDRPVPALLENGSFAVVRQLRQDVRGFWQFWRDQARGSEVEAVWLAAKAMGRWPNGMPLLPGPPGAEPVLREEIAAQPLSFRADARGTGCPLGAHVRRANPRDGLTPDPAVSQAIVDLHRMLRRGRVYGSLPPPEWYPRGLRRTHPGLGPPLADDEKGLLFMSLCGDIARQFEFIQQSWLNHPKHAELQNESDPVAAGDGIAGDGSFFSVPAEGFRRRVSGLRGWVTVRGGGYFLMPGRRALGRLLAETR
ncbi:MAG: Dyp-type peroxidase [Limisphaerales bacterium]